MGTTYRATWNGTVLAESDRTVEIEGTVYFPPEAVRTEHFRSSERTSVCPWKGTARYRHVEAGGERNADAAWSYPSPSAAAEAIRDHLAFWKGVTVTEVPAD